MNPEQIIRDLLTLAIEQDLVYMKGLYGEAWSDPQTMESSALAKLTERLRVEMERYAANQVREALRRRRSD
jgi:hypothetical protein